MGVLVLVAALAGLLAGLATGGSLRYLPHLKIRGLWLAVAACMLQAAGTRLPEWAASAANVAAYVVVLAVLWANRRTPGMALVGVGATLNALVIVLNGGRMPVSPGALAAAGAPAEVAAALAAGQVPFRFLAGPGTRLMWLADVIPVPRWVRWVGGVYSVGDFILAAGFGMIAFYAVRGVTRVTPRASRHGQPGEEPV